jgi:hypothetical protein
MCPSAPGRKPWLGAGLVEGPDLSDRHGPRRFATGNVGHFGQMSFFQVSNNTRSTLTSETVFPALAAGSPKGSRQGPVKEFRGACYLGDGPLCLDIHK